MKLLGLTLVTQHFEDYLSFLTEVLELDLAHLDDESMILQLESNLVEIRKSAAATEHKNIFIRFHLSQDEYKSLVNRISFFYYRKGETSFSVEKVDGEVCRLIDPDGRIWSFSQSLTDNFRSTVANL